MKIDLKILWKVIQIQNYFTKSYILNIPSKNIQNNLQQYNIIFDIYLILILISMPDNLIPNV